MGSDNFCVLGLMISGVVVVMQTSVLVPSPVGSERSAVLARHSVSSSLGTVAEITCHLFCSTS